MIRILTIARTVWLEMLRRKDLYVLLILMAALLFMLLSVNIFGLGGVVRYVTDVGLLFAWLFALVLSVSMACRQLTQEESKGTIYPLLAKPLTRWELIVGKWMGVWTAVVSATLLFYILVFSVVLLRGGKFDATCLLQALVLHVLLLSCVTALSIALSTRLTYGAAASMAYILVMASMMLAPNIPALLVNEQGISVFAMLVLYYALPHFELFDLRQRLVHEWGPASWPVIGQIALYGILWTLILLILAWLGYRTKRFKRGEAV